MPPNAIKTKCLIDKVSRLHTGGVADDRCAGHAVNTSLYARSRPPSSGMGEALISLKRFVGTTAARDGPAQRSSATDPGAPNVPPSI